MESRSVENALPITDIVKLLSTLLIGVTTAFYVLGLLVVNFRLAKFGISSHEFLRTEYVLVGAVFAFLVAIAHISFASGYPEVKNAFSKLKQKNIKGALGSGLTGFMEITAPMSVAFSILASGYYIKPLDMLTSIGVLIYTGFLTSILYDRIVSFVRKPKADMSDTGGKEIRLFGLLNKTLGLFPFLLIALGAYALVTYPQISTAFGGGRNAPVMLYPTDKGFEVCKELALPIQNEKKIVGPLLVLTETEKEIVILISDGLANKLHAVRLNRELFNAVQAVTVKDL